jgi:hypothetical protein
VKHIGFLQFSFQTTFFFKFSSYQRAAEDRAARRRHQLGDVLDLFSRSQSRSSIITSSITVHSSVVSHRHSAVQSPTIAAADRRELIVDQISAYMAV